MTDWELAAASRGCDDSRRPSDTTVVNPATGAVRRALASVEETDAADRAGARRRSRRGGPSRPASGPGCCGRFAAVVDATSRSWPQLEVRNAGHTIGNARWEAGNVRDCLNYYSAARSGSSAGRSRCPAAST